MNKQKISHRALNRRFLVEIGEGCLFAVRRLRLDGVIRNFRGVVFLLRDLWRLRDEQAGECRDSRDKHAQKYDIF